MPPADGCWALPRVAAAQVPSLRMNTMPSVVHIFSAVQRDSGGYRLYNMYTHLPLRLTRLYFLWRGGEAAEVRASQAGRVAK